VVLGLGPASLRAGMRLGFRFTSDSTQLLVELRERVGAAVWAAMRERWPQIVERAAGLSLLQQMVGSTATRLAMYALWIDVGPEQDLRPR